MKDSKTVHGTEISGPEMVADKTVKTPKKMASKTVRFLSNSVKGAVKGAIEAKTVDVEMPIGEAIAKPTYETEVFVHSRPTNVSRPSSLHSVAELAKVSKTHPTMAHNTPIHNRVHESVRTPVYNKVHENKVDKVVHNRTSRKTIDISNIQALQADMSEQFE